MYIFSRLCFTLTFYYFGYILPAGNISDTHLLNATWSPHARFHLAIFLIMTISFNALAFILAWLPRTLGSWPLRLSALMGVIIFIPNLLAMYFAGHYGGGQHTHDNSQVLFEINLPVWIMLCVCGMHIIGIFGMLIADKLNRVRQ